MRRFMRELFLMDANEKADMWRQLQSELPEQEFQEYEKEYISWCYDFIEEYAKLH